MISGAEFLTSKTPNWLKLAILLVIGVIILAAIRGYHNGKVTLAENTQLKEANKALKERIINDSIERKDSADSYQQAALAQEIFNSAQQDKLSSAWDSIDKANVRINKLLAKYKPISPSVDTNITTVPNEYIEECSQCFTELVSQQQREKNVKAQADIVQQSLNSTINSQQLRIAQMGREQVQANKNLNDCRAINEAYQKKLELRRRLYFSMGVMSIKSIFPNAAGLGLMYQDKRYRIVGFRMYTSEYGSVKALDIHMPLSFR